MGDFVININEMAINYLPKCKNQRKVSFLNETLPHVFLGKACDGLCQLLKLLVLVETP